jgi:hypothetical protein
MKILLILICFGFSINCCSQKATDTIAYRKKLLAHLYYPAGESKRLRPGKLKSLLLSEPNAKKYFVKYKTEQWGGKLAMAGGLLLAFSADTEKNRVQYMGKINPYVLTGAIIAAGGYYFLFHSMRQKHRAVKAYNRAVVHLRKAAL